MNSFIRIEGMNIGAVMDDTDDISVQRGASLLLRHAVKAISEEFNEDVEAVSIGASVGLYRVKDGNNPNDLMDRVTGWLNKHSGYRHLTFAVDITEESDFRIAAETLVAANRRRQLRQLSLALPGGGDGDEVCEFDQLRPADGKGVLKRRNHVSESVRDRFEFGRKSRQEFYEDELATDPGMDFSEDLETLAKGSGYCNLDGKIALIYFDGNHFGSIQRACQGPDALKRWDDDIQEKRRKYLSALIEMVRSDEAFHNTSKGGKVQSRLQVLMWGGDELMLVVPAWRGLDVVQHFYACSRDWEFDGQALTHAGGVVFCSHKAPLMRIRPLAKDLAEVVKGKGGGNRFEYLVLESIDYPAEPLELFWQRRFGEDLSRVREPLGAQDNWNTLRDDFASTIAGLPRRQVHDLALAIVKDPGVREKRLERMEQVMGAAPFGKLCDSLDKWFPNQSQNGGTDWRWLHLLELWDYIAPRKEKSS